MTGQKFEPQTKHMRKLVPFRVIVCAVAKDPEAMDQVIAHYNPYIIHLSNRPTRDEDGYFVASVPALRGCHTQAKSLDVLMKRIKEAIELCLEVQEPVTNEFIGMQRVAVMA